MEFHSGVFFPDLLLYFAAAALAAQLLSCFLAALRGFWRRNAARRRGVSAVECGITLLCPVAGGAEAARAHLNAVFAIEHRPKEIIICLSEDTAQLLAAVRAVREENARTASLLMLCPPGEKAAGGCATAGLGADRLSASLIKGWKAARYDRVAVISAEALPDSRLLARLCARSGSRKAGDAPLVCAAPWGVGAAAAGVQLEAAFLNGFRARRLAVADIFGAGAAQNTAQLWPYEMINAAGGINAYADAVAHSNEAAAAMQISRKAGQGVRLSFLPQPLDLSRPAKPDGFARFKALCGAQTAWLRFYRRFLPVFFYAELFLGALLPFAAMAAAWGCGRVSLLWLIGFAVLWYGAEAAHNFCIGKALRLQAAGAGRRRLISRVAALPARDMLLPVLWLYSLLEG